MFETAVLSYGPTGKRVWTTCLGMTGETLLVAVAILVPLISPAVLPKTEALVALIAPPTPPSRPQVREAPVPVAAPVVRPRQFIDGTLYQPVKPPVGVPVIEDPPDEPAGPYVVGAVPTGGPGQGVVGSLVDTIVRSVAQPTIVPKPRELAKAATVAAPAPAPRRIPISSLEQGTPILRVEPVYPPLALKARISGVVKLEGIIGIDGRIKELKVLGGHPMLVKAAIDAVAQWLYRPTVLNGQPVEVVAPITVTFTMK